ncbi:MAG: hypothetical protein KDB23_26810, partial [Planctomycetales bacterium]|nr:hypothetical protein [Planctomycetales bacterium]
GVFPDNGERVATGMSIVELARLRLVRHNTSLASDPVALEQFLTLQLSLLLSPEIREGKKFDINRLIGNGIDDDGDLIVDEPTESLNTTTGKVEEAVWPGTAFETRPVQFGGIDPNFEDATRGIDNSSNPIFSRQLLARYLYCLAYLAMDDNFEIEVASGDAKEITARRLAQWAINVVDFRDPDAIMTPFEYDVDPFDDNGWNVDDNYATVQAFEQADRRIVWGCESPELLITESKAIHDRRVRDTDLDQFDNNDPWDANPQDFTKRTEMPPNPVDGSLDQFRIPQGSLFLELMATGNDAQNLSTTNGALGLPSELYTNGLLDLSRVATDGTNTSPVWRIAITRPSNPASPVTTIANVMADPPRLAVLGPALAQLPLPYDDTFLALLNDPSLGLRFDSVASPTGLPEYQATQLYDRYIVFTNSDPSLVPPQSGVAVKRPYYFNYTNHAAPMVPPGGHVVIGPRQATAIGSVDRQQATPPITDSQPSEAAAQRIIMTLGAAPGQPGSVIHYADDGTFIQRPAVTFVAAAHPPNGGVNGWSNTAQTAPYGIGISVSEPVPGPSYYKEPIWGPSPPERLHPSAPIEPESYYGSLSTQQKTFPDLPFDSYSQNDINIPLAELPKLTSTGTLPNFRVALLQRLADPTRPWHAVLNPYITVDSQSIDLTVFNGEDKEPTGWDPMMSGEFDPDDEAADRRPIFFKARQRGLVAETTSRQSMNIWNPMSQPLTVASTPLAVSKSYFDYALVEDFGRLNLTYAPTPAGAPTVPATWLPWNNRPFVNSMELMMVPSSSPWRLPFEVKQIPSIAGK